MAPHSSFKTVKRRGPAQFLLTSLLLLTCSSADPQDPQEGYCLAKDPFPFSSFGERTAYEAADVNLDASPVQHPAGCRAVQLWLLGRHGTRHGSPIDILSILRLPKLQKRIRDNIAWKRPPQLCAEDLSRILEWSPDVGLNDSFQLNERGRTDMEDLGRRLRSRFPSIFQTGSDATFQFWHDSTPRTTQSSDYLRRGVLGSPSPPFETGWDSFPYFFSRCPSFVFLYTSETLLGSQNIFRRSKAYTNMIRRVSTRLGFIGMLSLSEICSIYDACSLEQAQRWGSGNTSPWCAVFRVEDFQVLEYDSDIQDYYNSGYGHETYARIGCVAMEQMTRALQSRAASGTSAPPSATFYMSHDLLVRMSVTYLGLYRDDEPLRPGSFDSPAMKNRKWRSSRFSPFAANIGAVLFECESGEQHRVQLFLNENPLALQGCEKETKTCTWTQFMDMVGGATDQCNKSSVCYE